MKKQVLSTLTALAAALLLATPAMAVDAHHPEKTAEAATAPAPAAAPNTRQTVQSMQGNVKKMRAQLDRMAAVKTDEARQKAMAEHMQTMHENMMLARSLQPGMMSCPMMDGMGKKGMMGQDGMGQGGGMGMMGGRAAQPDGASERMDKMEKRMDMMQQMMMERQPAPTAPAAK